MGVGVDGRSGVSRVSREGRVAGGDGYEAMAGEGRGGLNNIRNRVDL